MTGEIEIPLPSAQSTLLGQEMAEQRLLEAFGSNRLPHAWLLSGPRGIGKATLAYRFARFLISGGNGAGDLLAPEGGDLFLPEEHPVFRQVAAGAHPNLAVIQRRLDTKGKLSNVIKVDDVRKSISFLQHTAATGGWRVVIVDCADDLNVNAANALLKILEEPPAKSILLLIAQVEGALLPTIRSRCCRLPMSPLGDDLVEGLLVKWYPDLESDDQALILRLAEGSPGRARDLVESGGPDLYRAMIDLLGDLPRLSTRRLQAFGDRLAQGRDGKAFRTGLELLRWWIAGLVRSGAAAGSLGGLEEGELRAKLLDWRPPNFWLAFWEKLGQQEKAALQANLDFKQVTITTFLTLETLEP